MWRASLCLLAVTSVSACHGRNAPGGGAAADAQAVAIRADAGAASDPAAQERAAIINKVVALFGCFERGMRDSRSEPRFASYRRTSFTDVFVFDHLFADRNRIEDPEAALCEAALGQYRKLFLATSAKTARTTPARRAQGPQPRSIDAEPEFIRAAGGRTALHLLEHAEITRAALVELSGGRVRPVFDTVTFGAEQSDLYRWTDLRYHGQTEEFEPHLRESETATAKEAFVGFVAGVLNDFNEQLREGSFDRAAVSLGIACHAAQDVVFHHGMTRRQLAGLRFWANDDLYGSKGAAAQKEAARWTTEILGIARAAIGDKALWNRFMAWAPPPGFDLDAVARTIFRDAPLGQRLSYGALTTHWLSQLPYRRSPEARQELGEGPLGLIRWDVPSLFERIRRTVENGGITLQRQPTRR